MDNTPGSDDPFAGTFVYRCSVPMSLESIAGPIDTELVHYQNRANEILLDVLTTTPLSHLKQEEADGELKQYLVQLDSKLNLLLHWMGRMLSQQRQLPDKREIEINACAIKFSLTGQYSISLQDYCRLQLFLDDNYLEPLILYAQIIDILDISNDKVITARFLGCEEIVADMLERYIFKLHRHDVAKSKKQHNGDD